MRPGSLKTPPAVRDAIGAGLAENSHYAQRSSCLTLAEEHVPHAQHRGPRQRPREGAHEPLGHVQDGLQLVLLEVTVSRGRDAAQQRVEDLAVQLDGLLQGATGGAKSDLSDNSCLPPLLYTKIMTFHFCEIHRLEILFLLPQCW